MQIQQWIKRIQEHATKEKRTEEDIVRLNLQKNKDGLLECRGCMQGHYPVYLPENKIFTQRLVMRVHKRTLYWGVCLMTTDVRQILGTTAKRIDEGSAEELQRLYTIPSSFLCTPTYYQNSSRLPFQNHGCRFRWSDQGRIRSKKGNAYLILYACSITRGLQLELLPNLTAEEFFESLKR